ncbi:DUF1801 domain-containing protein [Flavobacterium foetidum]|uniref:DUF1801 domain-containing protein n=1 Tax=Flavobacterium foetidum TaxID=2026681 RepID=UPI00107500DA|nr:DUF1801 domain-containing protein [Flavobacterium foetidum]KAF2517027.1 DUF1801 domain-containing protein [Flavobacterium foetidum]
MAKNKTTETQSSVTEFINAVENETKRNDSFELVKIMQEATGSEPKIWGANIIGFGSYHYTYDSGHEGDAPLLAFSPRKDAISLYLNSTFENKEELLLKFGKHKAGKGCIYIKKLADIDLETFKKMLSESIKEIKKLYPTN